MAAFWNRGQPAPTEIRGDEEGSARIDEYLADQIRADGPGLALAVVESGTIVHAAGYGLADVASERPIAPETIFHLASCGKQFTGLGIMMLAEERKLDLDDPIGKHFAPLAGFGPKVRDIFTSGRTNDGNPTNYGSGWYLGAYQDMPFADHEGAWIGFRAYICRYLERPLSIFALSNHPELILRNSQTR